MPSCLDLVLRAPRLALLLGALQLVPPAFAAVVDLSPGATVTVRDNFNVVLTPGVNPGSDPSLAGTVVADMTRDFSMVVTTVFNGGGDPQTTVLAGQLHDWVVRRDDTGTLDFYFSMLPDAAMFAGTITRPWRLGGSGFAGAGWRDDGAPESNPPSFLSLAATGTGVAAKYFATDDGAPNWIASPNPSAAVLFRSDLHAFSVGSGQIVFGYGTEFSDANGSTSLDLFMPALVPEPATGGLVTAGLVLLGVAARRRR